VIPEPIDGYGCLGSRVGGDTLVAGNGQTGTVHTQPLRITASTTLRAGDLYTIRSANTALVRNPGVLSSATQSSMDLFPLAAIEIHGQNGIVLDCNRVWIQSQAGDLTADRSNDKFYEGVGIRVRNSSNIVVRNCNVSGYRYGILVEDSTGVTLENNRSTHNYRNFTGDFFSDGSAMASHHFGGGIRIWRGRSVRLNGNQGDNQMSGIELIATNDSEIANNRFNYDQVGLYVNRSSNNRVHDNNFDWGIRFETRTWSNGSDQRLERGGVFDFQDRGMLRVEDLGVVNGLRVKRIMRLLDRDTSRAYWDIANMTFDASGVLIENASHNNEIRHNSLNYGGDGLFIRANQTPCSTGNLIVDNEAAYSPNNGLELSFCDGRFENNLVHSNDHGMWLGAGAHDVVLRGNRFANNYSYAVLGTRNGPVVFEGNTVSDTPVAIAMQAERWPGSLNLGADNAVVRARDWSVRGNTFQGVRGGAFGWMRLNAAEGAVFRLSGVERFRATGNTYSAGSDRCWLAHPHPAPNTPPNVDLSLDCNGGAPPPGPPGAQFLSPTDGASIPVGVHHTFVCRGTDDAALRSIEIVFNNEHRARCDFTQAAAVKSNDCRFTNFYVGTDLNGRTVPMDCVATDWSGLAQTHRIGVTLGAPTDAPPYVQFTKPTDGQAVPTGHNDFTCYGSDDKNLAWIEILFNNEHRHRCNFGPVTSGSCTFSNFYIGTDMSGRTVPMRCTAADLAGKQKAHDIRVTIGSTSADTTPPYVQFTKPAAGQTVPTGHNDFTCYGSDDKSLAWIEILFNNEHRQRCSFGPVTSGNCTFSNFYVGGDMAGRTVPMRCTAADLAGNQKAHDINVTIGSTPDTTPPYVQFTKPTNGQTLPTGHNDFTCYGSDDKNLAWIEILFNNEHRQRCSFGPVTSGNCAFNGFYIGTDMAGRTVPMRCTAADLSGNQKSHDISVRIAAPVTDTTPPYAQFTRPTNGQTIPTGHNDFTCYGSDDKGLASVEILFNNEHRHQCSFGPVTSGNSTFGGFYVGTDMRGRSVPMRCLATDLSGNQKAHYISVTIGN
jgi:parallel beta-helix repeat protein